MPKGRPATPDQIAAFARYRQQGWTIRNSAEKVGLSYEWGKEQNSKLPANARKGRKIIANNERGPTAKRDLSPEAKKALRDIGYFARRYFGLILLPWQIEAANTILDAYRSPHREFIVVNAPPGAGKTTMMMCIAAWLTCHDRAIRGLFGSQTASNASTMMLRLRRTFERFNPTTARTDLQQLGLAVDAEACLAWDYGTFRPEHSDTWAKSAFIVAQPGEALIEEKEPTWSSYGLDSGVLGNRFNFMMWDDPDNHRTLRTTQAIEDARHIWDTEIETRLEPAGCFVIVQQRLGPHDLSRHCLDKRTEIWDDDADDVLAHDPDAEHDDRPAMYRHIVYKAHDATRCDAPDTHRRTAAPWPDGCLLDPYRLPWRDLRRIELNSPDLWAVQYQGEDVDPADVLIPRDWIWGGVARDGAILPGCVDKDRDVCDPIPSGLVGPRTSIATVDPSGTRMWAIQWWVFVDGVGESPRAYLMDLERKSMQANQLLDWNASERVFYGIMEEWQQRSVQMGLKITHWVIEVNAAQRYLLAYDHVRRWMAHHRVAIIPHTTGPFSKAPDSERGPTILRDWFRHGRVVLPGLQGAGAKARISTMKLTTELERYPNHVTDDQVMAAWFAFMHMPRIVRPGLEAPRQRRPSWMAGPDHVLSDRRVS